MIELFNNFLNLVVIATGIMGVSGIAYFAYKDLLLDNSRTNL